MHSPALHAVLNTVQTGFGMDGGVFLLALGLDGGVFLPLVEVLGLCGSVGWKRTGKSIKGGKR